MYEVSAVCETYAFSQTYEIDECNEIHETNKRCQHPQGREPKKQPDDSEAEGGGDDEERVDQGNDTEAEDGRERTQGTCKWRHRTDSNLFLFRNFERRSCSSGIGSSTVSSRRIISAWK